MKNNKTLKTLITLFIFVVLTGSVAQGVEYKKISLDDAIQLSLSNNLDLQSERIEVELAKNGIKIANRLQNPDLNIFYNYGKAGRSEPQQIGVKETFEIAKRAPRKKLAKSELYKRELTVKLSEFTLEMDVRETYVDLVGAKTVLKTLLEQEKFFKDLYEVSKQRCKEGKASQTDVIQAQIALNKLSTQINAAQTAVISARNDFNKALNIKAEKGIVYDTKEETLPGETVFISLKTPDCNVNMPPFESFAKRALDKRLDIRTAKNDVEIAQKNLTVVARQRIPDLEVFGGYAYLAKNHADSGQYAPGAYAGAAINNIPVFYSYKPEIKNAKLYIEQTQIRYESAFNKAVNDLNTAYERLLLSQTNLMFYKNKLVKDSEDLIKISREDYLKGKTDLTSVIVLEESYREMLTGYIKALTDYYTDWIDFLREVNQEDFNLFTEDV